MTQTLHKTESRAVMHLVKGISRKTSVMGWARTITWQDIKEKDPFTYQTLNVVRAPTTIYNEFFTCQVTPREFKNTLLRIQICDIDEYDGNVVVAEMDYWINTHIISQFTQFELPFPPFTPDLGEIELHTAYLPVSQRLIFHYSTVTNLKLDDKCTEIFVRGVLFVGGRQFERYQSETKIRTENACTDDGMHFTHKIIFDLDRKYVPKAEVLIHVMQKVDDKTLVVGQVTLSMRHSGQCQQMLKSLRTTVSRVHRLTPSAG
uniref:C2 domain-containing protein n=1 Tax=Caenorhabditis tropicalis TaxID=1561998 RepID=A0A1I7UKE2_9PELO